MSSSSAGSTRGAAAATSRDVKQKLVNLLFRDEHARTGPEGHKRLDFSIYSYEDLRKAYLKRLLVIHPDKLQSNSADIDGDTDDEDIQRPHFEDTSRRIAPNQTGRRDASSFRDELKEEFQELQSTWDRYEELSKSMMKVRGDGVAANFTKFGVGCSFSDNEEESALRREITDQACRGWFSSGLVSSGLTNEQTAENDNSNSQAETETETETETEMRSKPKPLIDDTMFIPVESSVSSGLSDASNLQGKRDSARHEEIYEIKYIKK
eukprot:jgi/Psemu1/299522/fgenesh1_pm.1700_\